MATIRWTVQSVTMNDPRGPKAGIPGASARRAAAFELVSLVEAALDNLWARLDDLPKQFGVAAMARGARLIRGIASLREAGLPDVASVPLRPMMECVIASLYCLL